MTIQRITLVLAGSLFLTGTAFAGTSESKRERLEIVDTYAGVEDSTMIPVETSEAVTLVLPEKERGNLNK